MDARRNQTYTGLYQFEDEKCRYCAHSALWELMRL